MGEYYSKLKELYQNNVSKPGLVRVTELLKRLGNPQNELKCVHVAGTNGKGSTCAYIESVLRSAGYKTALFSSPHIYDIFEYIKIDNEDISENKLEEYAKPAFEACKKMEDDGFQHPTFFEIMTAIAFYCFNDSAIDIAIIETGMGGSGDATNVICPILSVITPISYDHMEFLGDSLTEIAREKAGIIKNGIPTVMSPNQPRAVQKVIKSKCNKMSSDLIDASKYKIGIYGIDLDHTSFTASVGKEILRFRIKNMGRHQAENAVTALCALEVISQLGFPIGYSDIKSGINSMRIDSRIQVYKDRKIIVDASHNEEGVHELKAAIREVLPDAKAVLLCSMLNTKNLDAMAREYSGFADYAFLTRSSHPLAAGEKEMSAAFGNYNINHTYLKSPAEAAEKALEKCSVMEAYLLVSGSFYFIADVKEALGLI